jgi:hypothetical protein
MMHWSNLWRALSLFILVSLGCSGKPSQPTSTIEALVRYQSEVLIDVKVDVYHRQDKEWKLLLSGVSSSTQPFYLLPAETKQPMPSTGELRVTLESVGATVVPFKSVYQDPAKTPLQWQAPLLAGETKVIDLPKDSLSIVSKR